VPALTGTRPIEELLDMDSQFVEVNDLGVHYKQRGADGLHLLLLHGFASSTYSWREVMEPLGACHQVVAFDRPAFGFTERPERGQWVGRSPYSPEAQADLTIGLMDELDMEEAVLVGNSAGGAIAMLTALAHPERIRALVLVSPAVYSGGGAPSFIRPLLNTPQMDHLGPLIARAFESQGIRLGQTAWHDPSRLTPEIWEAYTRPLQVEGWDRALWELTRSSRTLGLEQRLDELTLPVLVVTGDDDRVVPTEQSVRVGEALPNAELVVIPACGHVAHEECPDAFLSAVTDFLASLEGQE
jgi:pimeloyl-ACP methyl ester carboxylesterase